MTYYSFRNIDTSEYEGLLRFDPSAASYERAIANGWEPGSPDRLQMFVFPGADGPERIAPAVAEQLAARYGVTL